MPIVTTITPIFIIILAGYLIRNYGFLRKDFFDEANRFVFFFSLPLLIFTGIMKSDLSAFSPGPVISVGAPTIAILVASLLVAYAFGLRRGTLGTFTQSAFHGNVSYVGLAVLVYLLGEEALRQGSLMVAVLIIVNNVLATLVLEVTALPRSSRNFLKPLLSVARNPVVIASLLAVLFVLLGISLPVVIVRSMTIMANIALPLALIVIGASLDLPGIKRSLKLSILSTLIKLVILPFLALLCVKGLKLPPLQATVAVLLLCTPTATTTFVMAQEMRGDTQLASNAVTLSTLLSPLAFIAWALYMQ